MTELKCLWICSAGRWIILDEWTRLDIFTTSEGVEVLTASLTSLGITGFQVQDPHDFEDFLEHKGAYWDYYDEELLKLKDAEVTVTLYIPRSDRGGECLQAIKQELIRLKTMDLQGGWGRLEYQMSGVREEDWESNWKQYYHPVKVGERLVICPSWEEYDASAGEVVVRLDPGMAFGTGTHESTRLCMQLTETYLKKGTRVLDLGCGSGILGISAYLLGANSVLGLDIDEVAVRVANENAEINGAAKKCRFVCDTVSSRINGNYGLIYANIVADVLIDHVEHIVSNLGDYGVLIASGIIDTREKDVLDAFSGAGLGILERKTERGWVALACQRNRI